MATFRISSHGRLQDWIAAEKGYFDEAGLDYELDVRVLENADQDIERSVEPDVRVGAYELYRSGGGGKKNMSCACHWAVNQAATDAAGRMWGHAYSILPSGIYVRADSDVRRAEDLAGVEVAVGYHSGSHFSTIQALEACLDPSAIRLAFVGMPYDRVDALLEGDVSAAAVSATRSRRTRPSSRFEYATRRPKPKYCKGRGSAQAASLVRSASRSSRSARLRSSRLVRSRISTPSR